MGSKIPYESLTDGQKKKIDDLVFFTKKASEDKDPRPGYWAYIDENEIRWFDDPNGPVITYWYEGEKVLSGPEGCYTTNMSNEEFLATLHLANITE